MRALTIRQPWASLISLGVKRYETRSRPTRVRGRIAIHAGMSMPCGRLRTIALHSSVTATRTYDDLLIISLARLPMTGPGQRHVPLGAVVATAELVACHQVEVPARITDLERALGDWTPGRWAWELADVRPFAVPVPAKGNQGWWDWTPEGPVA